ncbi:MAG TPA: energy transducer TonB [Melioribacteraceae bacterium]|nr:energy transducer TonB [Melioribacteraceae bacterium]
MKRYYLILVGLIFFMACGQQNCSDEDLFLNPSLTDVKAKLITSNAEITGKIDNAIDEKSLSSVLGSGTHYIKISVAVNKEAKCNHIGFTYEGESKFKTSKILPYFEKIKEVFSNFTYQAATVEEKKVNSFLVTTLKIKFDEFGKVEENWAIVSDIINSSKNKHEGYYEKAEVMPEIIGGIQALAKNIVYPPDAKEKGIQGKVFVKVYIDEQGNVFDTEIIKSLEKSCDEAAINAVKNLKFKPAVENGKNVKVVVVIPIQFRLG